MHHRKHSRYDGDCPTSIMTVMLITVVSTAFSVGPIPVAANSQHTASVHRLGNRVQHYFNDGGPSSPIPVWSTDHVPPPFSSPQTKLVIQWPRGGAAAASSGAADSKGTKAEHSVLSAAADGDENELGDHDDADLFAVDGDKGFTVASGKVMDSHRRSHTSANDSVASDPKQRSQTRPVAVTIKTDYGCAILDVSLELTVNPQRNIASLKDTVRRQLPARPPVSTMALAWNGKPLPDDTIIDELLSIAADDDDDDDDVDDELDQDNHSTAPRIMLQLDMIPPVDPKFSSQLQSDLQHLTASALLDSYVANEAALYQNTLHLDKESRSETNPLANDLDEGSEVMSNNRPLLITSLIKDQSQKMRQNLEATLLKSPNAQRILTETTTPAVQKQSLLLASTIVRGYRVRHVAVSSVRTSFKRQIQRVWNIDWSASIRYSVLFLFFGWFGGRTPTSRAILLLGAPSVFVLQARPVKLIIKQWLYFLLLHPPSIILSLLPAPQQAILALNMDQAMKSIYGSYYVPVATREAVPRQRSNKAGDGELDAKSNLFEIEESDTEEIVDNMDDGTTLGESDDDDADDDDDDQ